MEGQYYDPYFEVHTDKKNHAGGVLTMVKGETQKNQ